MYNPEKIFSDKILASIKRTWKGQVSIYAGYPIIKNSYGYLLEHDDGVGTKGLLHWKYHTYSNAAIDAFAMNANDLAILGFTPISMTSHLILEEEKEEVILSLVDKLSLLAQKYNLIFSGGETAILNTIKGMEVSVHMTGFTSNILDKPLQEGDLIYGHLSNGIHSNGLTLARKLLDYEKDEFLIKELTRPTEIYLDLLNKTLPFVKKRMHITGGAFTKLKKIISPTIDFELDLESVELLTIYELLFDKLKEASLKPSFEMLRTFNCGIGFIEIVDEDYQDYFEKVAPKAKLIGTINKKGKGRVIINSPFESKTIIY